MEENGWIRRGMFVAGLGAAQFAMTAAVDMLRSLRAEPERPEAVHLAASDPANPYGSLLPWPGDEPRDGAGRRRERGPGQRAARGIPAPAQSGDPRHPAGERTGATRIARELARSWRKSRSAGRRRRSGLLIGEINDAPAREHFLARFLEEAGFVRSPPGFQMRRVAEPVP